MILKYFLTMKSQILLILLGTISWSLTMVKSGWVYSYGMGFWGPNGHDGVWHLALINSLARGAGEMPVFAGAPLQNYHIGFDFLIAAIKTVTQIPAQVLYFQILPPVFAFLIGWLTYKFVIAWRTSQTQALWALFFVYFGSGFGWIVTLLRDKQIGGESMFWAQAAVSTPLNPPFALSIIFILSALLLLLSWGKTKNPFNVYLLIVVFVLISQVKVYAGFLAFAALGLITVLNFLKDKNWRSPLMQLLFTSSILSLFLFLAVSKGSTSLLVFQPFWFLETMMAVSDRVGWQKFYEAMINYRASGNWSKATLAYTVAFCIFLLGNFGARILILQNVFKVLKRYKNLGASEVFLYTIIFLGLLMPMLFLQKGTPWNTIQFLYYSLFFAGILAGITVGEWVEKQKTPSLKYLIGIIIIILTIPTTLGTLWYHYLPGRPPAMISKEELEALSFLAKQPYGVVLTYPYDKEAARLAESNPPRPLRLYEYASKCSA